MEWDVEEMTCRMLFAMQYIHNAIKQLNSKVLKKAVSFGFNQKFYNNNDGDVAYQMTKLKKCVSVKVLMMNQQRSIN